MTSPLARREDRLALAVPVLFCVFSVAYAAVGLVDGRRTLPIAYANLAGAVCWATLAFAARRRALDEVRWLMFVVAFAQVGASPLLYGRDLLTHLFLLVGLPGGFLLFPEDQRRRLFFLTALDMAIVVAVQLFAEPRLPISAGAVETIRNLNVVGVLVLTVALSFYVRRAVTTAEDDLAREHAKSERLLLNILPASIAARLKERPGTIAERFESATILFADIAGFTPLAQRMPPADVVAMLDEIFRELDALAEKHGLEKIKTIGDAYMAAAGIPEPCDDHARRVAEMALDMRDRMATRFAPKGLALRIGIATGPVVAGVIGEKKFSYDLWGDAVNTASRMESHGAPGRIQLSASSRALLGDAYRFEARGTIDIKGKGPMEVFFLEGRVEASGA